MTRPLKFCFLSIFYPPYSFGGDAIYVERLAKALVRRGHEAHVIHCVDAYRASGGRAKVEPIASTPNLQIHTLQSRLGMLAPLISQQTGGAYLQSSAISKILASTKFDVIHYHNVSLFGPKVFELAPPYPDFVKLYTAHEYWLVCPMHMLWKDNNRLCDTPDCVRCSLSFHRPPQLWRYSGLLAKAAQEIDTFITPSQFSKEMHHRRGFERSMQVLPLFVPDRALASKREESPFSRPYFLFSGRLERLKGLAEVIPAFRDNPHADLLIAGTGNDETRLKELARDMSNVTFLGWCNQERLAALYQNAIALIVPSLWYEASPLVMLEAFAQGTPVIAHDIGGFRALVNQAQAGFIYSNQEELKSALGRLRTDGELRRQFSENGRRAYLEYWTEEIHLRRYLEIVIETAERKFGPRWGLGRRGVAPRIGRSSPDGSTSQPPPK